MSGATIANLIGAAGPRADAGPGGVYQDLDLFGAGAAVITLAVNSNGTATITGINDGLVGSWNWQLPAGIPSSWTVRVDVSSGGFDSGSSTGADLALSTNRAWVLSRTDPSGTDTVTFTITLKDSGGNTLDTSSSFTLNAVRP